MPEWWTFVNTLVGLGILVTVIVMYARLRRCVTDLEIKFDRAKYDQCKLQDELKETKAKQHDSRIIHPEPIVTHTVKTSTSTTTEQPKEG